MNIAQLIRKRRATLGMTREEFAEHIGVSVGQVGAWERGNVQDGLTKTARQYLRIYAEDVSTFLPKSIGEVIEISFRTYAQSMSQYTKETVTQKALPILEAGQKEPA